LITQQLAKGSVSGRIEAFETRNRGSGVVDDDNEEGWAATVAFRHPLGGYASILLEALHVSSRREARLREDLSPRQVQTQLQAALRLHW
jgi:hypothetical protein